LRISISGKRGAVNRLGRTLGPLLAPVLALVAGLALTSCGAAPASTAVTCTTTTASTTSTSSTSTCTDPVTNISVTISPATVSVNVVTTQQFQVSIQGGTNSIAIWQVNGTQGGSDTAGRIDSNGLYHAPVSVPSPNTVTVTAVSFEDQKVSAASTVTITPAPTVTLTSPATTFSLSCTSSSPLPPACDTLVKSGSANTLTFSATETGGSTNTILWSVAPVGGLGAPGGNAILGTISASGVYSPPATPPVGQTVTVIASAADSPTSTAALDVTIAGYSISSLQGQFAFSLSGSNAAGHFFRAGSFTADGAGNLSNVLEDVNATSSTAANPISTTGTYTVATDGRGTLQFNDGLTPAMFAFVLVNGTQMQMNGFDSTGTASGQANAQDASTFAGTPLSALNGTYVFDFSGVQGSNALSQIGEFTADGAGNIASASIDINDGGTLSTPEIYGSRTTCTLPSPATTPPPPPVSSYVVSSNGRGTLTFNTIDPQTCLAGPSYVLDFYVVSRGRAEFVGATSALQVAGFTTEQAPNATFDVAAINGNYAFLLAGSGPAGAIATAGSFSANGAGCFTANSGVLDENSTGTVSSDFSFSPLPLSDPTCPGKAGKYTVESNGRGTITFATAARTYNLVFYLGPVGNNTTAVVQETDSGIASDGNFTLQQSAAFTLASIKGDYAMATSQVFGSSVVVITGQIATDGAGAIPGVAAGNPVSILDLNIGGTIYPQEFVNGGFYTAPAANGRAILTIYSGPLIYAAYIVNSAQVYLVGTEVFMGQVPSFTFGSGTLLHRY
jgi:hypothetical protein